MSTEFSKAKLLDFLTFLGKKGLMKEATTSARKAAVNTLLGILSDEEASDLRNIDLDSVVVRFSNLKGNEFKPESLRVYKSRVSNALEDLINYKNNPLSFKPSVALPRVPLSKPVKIISPGTNSTSTPKSENRVNEVIFPIPIRPGLIVQISGVPEDLSKNEATRIANVILALAKPGEH